MHGHDAPAPDDAPDALMEAPRHPAVVPDPAIDVLDGLEADLALIEAAMALIENDELDQFDSLVAGLVPPSESASSPG